MNNNLNLKLTPQRKQRSIDDKYDPENLTSLLAFEDTLYLAMEKRKNQAKITDFFKKQ